MAYVESGEVVVRYDDISGHERSKAVVAGRIGGTGYRRQSSTVEVAVGEHVKRLVHWNLLDVIRPLTSQLQSRLKRLHSCSLTVPRAVFNVVLHAQWRTQDFRMGGVEVPQAPRGWGMGRGYPPPYWGKGLGRGCAPSPEIFFVFFVENTIF